MVSEAPPLLPLCNPRPFADIGGDFKSCLRIISGYCQLWRFQYRPDINGLDIAAETGAFQKSLDITGFAVADKKQRVAPGQYLKTCDQAGYSGAPYFLSSSCSCSQHMSISSSCLSGVSSENKMLAISGSVLPNTDFRRPGVIVRFRDVLLPAPPSMPWRLFSVESQSVPSTSNIITVSHKFYPPILDFIL